MATAVTLIRGRRRRGVIQGLPASTESCLRLPTFTQWAAVSTLVGAISEPLQMKRRFWVSATANCQPTGLALPPPTMRGEEPAAAPLPGAIASNRTHSPRAAPPKRRCGVIPRYSPCSAR